MNNNTFGIPEKSTSLTIATDKIKLLSTNNRSTKKAYFKLRKFKFVAKTTVFSLLILSFIFQVTLFAQGWSESSKTVSTPLLAISSTPFVNENIKTLSTKSNYSNDDLNFFQDKTLPDITKKQTQLGDLKINLTAKIAKKEADELKRLEDIAKKEAEEKRIAKEVEDAKIAKLKAEEEAIKAAQLAQIKAVQDAENARIAALKPATATPAPSVAVSGGLADWMAQAGIAASDYNNVYYIINKESTNNYRAVNPSSGAYGLCQALPGNKMASAGSDWQTNPVTQLRWCDSYAKSRYGGWAGAYNFWIGHNWW